MRSAAWHCSERDSKTRAARGSQRHSQPRPRGLREAPEGHGQPALPRRCRSPRPASPASSTPTPAPRPLWDVRRRGRRLKQGFRRGHRTPDRDKPHPDCVPCPETVTDGDGLEPPFRHVSAFKAFCPTRVSDRAGQRDHSAHAPHGPGRGGRDGARTSARGDARFPSISARSSQRTQTAKRLLIVQDWRSPRRQGRDPRAPATLRLSGQLRTRAPAPPVCCFAKHGAGAGRAARRG